jgi:exosortase B
MAATPELTADLPSGPAASRLAAWPVLLGWLALAGPSLWDYLFGTWSSYSQGHELLLLGVTGWLVWRVRDRLQAAPVPRTTWPALIVLGIALLGYAFGRTQEFIRIELLSLWVVSMCLVWLQAGWAGLRATGFAWVFALFAMPLPFSWVLALTGPLKAAVSVIATAVLQALDYPVGRSGVVITVGQYQLLVAEACAGLSSMFTLEAMGMLYSHLMARQSWAYNVTLAVLAIPVAFVSNVARVIILVLITYYFGDGVGQGFAHSFSGAVLFATALVLMACVDLGLRRVFKLEQAA